MTTPAGWYPDTEGSGGQRYWDGYAWTDHRTAGAPPVAVGAAGTTAAGPDKRLLIGLGAAVVVLIVVAVVGVVLTMKNDVGDITVTHRPGEASASSDAPSETDGEGPTETQAASTGEEVRVGDFVFVVNGVETADVIADPEFPELNTTADGEYVIVDLTVTNVSTDTQTFFASFNTLSDGATEFEADDEAWVYLGNTVTDVVPGASIETAVVFDVPKGTDLESIRLRDGPLSEGVAVGL